VAEQVADGGVENRDDAGDDDTDGDGQDYGQGVQGDGASHDQWLQDVAFELLYGDDHAQNDQCLDRADGDECDEHGDGAGEGALMTGMKALRKTRAASSRASGTRRIAMPMPAASTKGTSAVARTYDTRVCSLSRPNVVHMEYPTDRTANRASVIAGSDSAKADEAIRACPIGTGSPPLAHQLHAGPVDSYQALR
jgi:hypothetical protein